MKNKAYLGFRIMLVGMIIAVILLTGFAIIGRDVDNLGVEYPLTLTETTVSGELVRLKMLQQKCITYYPDEMWGDIGLWINACANFKVEFFNKEWECNRNIFINIYNFSATDITVKKIISSYHSQSNPNICLEQKGFN